MLTSMSAVGVNDSINLRSCCTLRYGYCFGKRSLTCATLISVGKMISIVKSSTCKFVLRGTIVGEITSRKREKRNSLATL